MTNKEDGAILFDRQEEIMQQHAKSGKFGKQETLQEENRKMILEADESLKEYDRSELRLNQVLLALEKQFKNEYHKMIFQDGQLFFICLRECAIQFYWDLTKETVEEQAPQTQTSINKLLTIK